MKKIKDLPRILRPREKIKKKGVLSLSDQELIAVILGSGQKNTDIMTIAKKVKKILNKSGENITLKDLSQVEGVGLAKATQILASFELSRRFLIKSDYKISNALDVLPLLSEIKDKKQEYFVCITVNGAHEVIETRIITVGLLNESQIHPREVFADAITDRAASVILAHNHPSGKVKPSQHDIYAHQILKQAGEIIGIQVLDHIIISKKAYFSFQENDIL